MESVMIHHDAICLLFSCGLHLTDSYIVNTLLIEVALELLKAFELNLLRSDILPLRTLYTLRSFILQKTSESPSCNMTGVKCCWSFLDEVNFPNPPPKRQEMYVILNKYQNLSKKQYKNYKTRLFPESCHSFS